VIYCVEIEMTLFDVLCPLNNFQTFAKINHTHKTQIKYASNIKIKNITNFQPNM